MEHVTIKSYRIDPSTGKQLYRITPDEGYLLKDLKTGKLYSDAITDNPNGFEVIAIN